MKTISISDFRKNIKKHLDSVSDNFETLIVKRGKCSGVVVMSMDAYFSLITARQHERPSKINEARLDSAIEKFKQGASFAVSLFPDLESQNYK